MVCSICGIGGHNKRTCPKKQVIATPLLTLPTSIFAEWVDRGVGAWMDASGIPTKHEVAKPKTSCMEVEIALLCLVKELPQEAQTLITRGVFSNRLPTNFCKWAEGAPSNDLQELADADVTDFLIGYEVARRNSINNTLIRCNGNHKWGGVDVVCVASAGKKQFGKERKNKAQFQLYFYALEPNVRIYDHRAGILGQIEKAFAAGLITECEAMNLKAEARDGSWGNKRAYKGLSVSSFDRY